MLICSEQETVIPGLLLGPNEGCGNLLPWTAFNLRDSSGFVVGEAVLKCAIHQINGDRQYPLQCYLKHCLSLSCSWTAWEDWQMFHCRVDRHLLEFSLTNTGNVIRLSPMFCASALINTLLSVKEKSQEQHQKKFPLASKWVLPRGSKNIFLLLTCKKREETNQFCSEVIQFLSAQDSFSHPVWLHLTLPQGVPALSSRGGFPSGTELCMLCFVRCLSGAGDWQLYNPH